ncbi:hypothetical protein LX69_03034 [Breznakibacter xylanolyticus]|uniref:Uncharacterized protein n=1 Tax=Breznakibacter xylanolyticus TaxID=990 RepID=A0A2W7MVY1_9BACT|nr:hypothetical protein [Breznakibacter xylanolyticus]PZX11801.1 hypothetical protein LX69_03034 [Breznakibacter xylanolyticus]
MKNPVQFSYRITQNGMAKMTFAVNGNQVDFDATNHANPLYDLLNGMAGMILNPAHMWGEENQAWIEWYGQNGALRWVLTTPDGDTLQVKIFKITDIFDDSGTDLAIDASCKMNLFFYAILKELDDMIKQMGLLNYSQKWQKDEFPVTTFLFLKKQLIDKGVWEITTPQSSILAQEMDLLLG